MKIHHLVAEMIYADGRTDTTELKDASRDLAKSAQSLLNNFGGKCTSLPLHILVYY